MAVVQTTEIQSLLLHILILSLLNLQGQIRAKERFVETTVLFLRVNTTE